MIAKKKTRAQLDAEIERALSRKIVSKDADFFEAHTHQSKVRQKMLHRALLEHQALIVTSTDGRRTLLIRSGEMSYPGEGAFRVTQYHEDGPVGHITRKDVTRLAQDLSRDLMPRKVVAANEATVVAWMSTPEFLRGVDRVLEVQRANERRR
jgi:hypothetical protein